MVALRCLSDLDHLVPESIIQMRTHCDKSNSPICTAQIPTCNDNGECCNNSTDDAICDGTSLVPAFKCVEYLASIVDRHRTRDRIDRSGSRSGSGSGQTFLACVLGRSMRGEPVPSDWCQCPGRTIPYFYYSFVWTHMFK